MIYCKQRHEKQCSPSVRTTCMCVVRRGWGGLAVWMLMHWYILRLLWWSLCWCYCEVETFCTVDIKRARTRCLLCLTKSTTLAVSLLHWSCNQSPYLHSCISFFSSPPSVFPLPTPSLHPLSSSPSHHTLFNHVYSLINLVLLFDFTSFLLSSHLRCFSLSSSCFYPTEGISKTSLYPNTYFQ